MGIILGKTPEPDKEGEEADKRGLCDLTAREIMEEVNKTTETVRTISDFKKGYKGTSRKVLKEAASVVSNAVEELCRRTQSDECQRLEAENALLKNELAAMKKRMEEIEREVKRGREQANSAQSSEPPYYSEGAPTLCPPTEGRKANKGATCRKTGLDTAAALEKMMEDRERALTERMAVMMDARIAVVSERLLPERSFRPQLGADSKGAKSVASPTPRTYAEVVTAPAKTGTREVAAGKAKKPLPKPQPQNQPAATAAPRETRGAGAVGAQRSRERGTKAAGASSEGKRKSAPRPTPKSTPSIETPKVSSAPSKPEWTEVTRGKGMKRETTTAATKGTNSSSSSKKGTAPKKLPAPKTGASETGKGDKAQSRATPQPKKKIRLPKRAAIMLSLPPRSENEMEVTNADESACNKLAEAMARAKEAIKLDDHKITALKPKRTATGSVMYEVIGEDSCKKVESLAAALKEVMEPKGIRVTIPVKKAELRITGIDDSTTPEEVAAAIAENGDCNISEVKVGKIGRSPRNGLGAVWIQCPARAACKIESTGPLNIGWTRVRVEVLGSRPMQCYRCMGAGHTRATCQAEVDRSGLCYRCGQPGHKAGECSAEPNCPLCKGSGQKADHRYGSKACSLSRTSNKNGKQRKKEATKPSNNEKESGVEGNKVTSPTAITRTQLPDTSVGQEAAANKKKI